MQPAVRSSAIRAAAEVIECAGRWITPGLIDCHTCLVHAAKRVHKFELRLSGTSYRQIFLSHSRISAHVNSSDFVKSPRHFLHTQIHEGAHLRRHKG
jgi:imidazolonepropionase-like amidohydrolase